MEYVRLGSHRSEGFANLPRHHDLRLEAPIVGASKMHHMEDAVKALDLHLDAEEIKALEEPYEPHPVLGHS